MEGGWDEKVRYIGERVKERYICCFSLCEGGMCVRNVERVF